ncbi:aa3-type cytochrome oxidase subunit CtaJ [Pseudonocardia thermophila]|uniref:aa3-type cytochrome oxidase subunit CtaJ n=1 Tax=Pseudonocardia thermophila TaxID=1848 RepID=UPI0011610514|nr:hypothetical protein [Pseudonocardia thermophila]
MTLSVPETILFLGVGPVVIYAVVAALVAVPKLRRRPKYRPGDPWNFKPLWWTANPAGAQLPAATEHPRTGDKGGARGNW